MKNNVFSISTYLGILLIIDILFFLVITNNIEEQTNENIANLYSRQDAIYPHHLDVSEIKIIERNITHTIISIPTNKRVGILPTGSSNPFMGAGNMVFIER